MWLFSKAEKIQVELPFRVVTPTPDDLEACCVDLEAYGLVGDGIYQYYYASTSINPTTYDAFVHALTNSDVKLKMTVKVKNGAAKSFKIDFKDLAKKLQNDAFAKGEIAAYGINDESFFTKINK